MEFYVIKNKHTGKFSDGGYGWDMTVIEEDQIFESDRLPYIPNEDMEFICVGREMKPSIKSVQLQLGLQEI
jgi:hypothetical protein